jgi:hypothetical protein
MGCGSANGAAWRSAAPPVDGVEIASMGCRCRIGAFPCAVFSGRECLSTTGGDVAVVERAFLFAVNRLLVASDRLAVCHAVSAFLLSRDN